MVVGSNMLGAILGIVLVIGAIALVLYLAATYFPRLTKLWLAALIAAVVLGVIRALHTWLCGLVCG